MTYKQRVVVVDPDPVNLKVVNMVLEDAGFEVATFMRGTGSLDAIIGRDTQLVVLEVNLPDINGFHLLKELRARRYCGPVVFLTGRSDLEDKLEGFHIGADDYIVKPYEPRELVARAQNVIRRFHHNDRQSQGSVVRVDDAELDLSALTYTSEVVGDPVVLSPTEMKVLECLMRNANIVITRDRLIERVWGYDLEGDTNRVDVYIRRTRRKIEMDPATPTYLHTVRGTGYVFRPEKVSMDRDILVHGLVA